MLWKQLNLLNSKLMRKEKKVQYSLIHGILITFFSRLDSKNKVVISVVSATGYITVNHSIEEVKKMLGLDQ